MKECEAHKYLKALNYEEAEKNIIQEGVLICW